MVMNVNVSNIKIDRILEEIWQQIGDNPDPQNTCLIKIYSISPKS